MGQVKPGRALIVEVGQSTFFEYILTRIRRIEPVISLLNQVAGDQGNGKVSKHIRVVAR
jgi:hypothetical protein